MIPAAPSLALASRDQGNIIFRIVDGITENTNIVSDLFNTALSAIGTNVILCGITVPVSISVGIVVIATSIYVFNKTYTLQHQVSNVEECRSKIIELTESYTGERLKQEVDIVFNNMYSSYDICDTAGDLELTLRVIHEYFADAIDHISPQHVDSLRTVGIEMRQIIPEFLSTLNSLVTSMNNNFAPLAQIDQYISCQDIA